MPPKSFPPVIGDDPKVLILGTLPGKPSLRIQQYYGNPRNAFWKIIYALWDEPLDDTYEQRTIFLKAKQIAIWDVCHTAERKSSLDADISAEVPNPLGTFLAEQPSIKLVTFNGQKAAKLYNKHFTHLGTVAYQTLLSTSPANASYSFDQKLDDWRILLDYLH